MFENVAQLENEVKDFEKNILASVELVQSIKSLAASIADGSNKISEETSTAKRDIIEQSDRQIQKFTEASDKICTDAAALVASFHDTAAQTRDGILSDNKEVSEDTVQQYKVLLDRVMDKVDSLSSLLQSAQLEFDNNGRNLVSTVQSACAGEIEESRKSTQTLIQKIDFESQTMLANYSDVCECVKAEIKGLLSSIENSNTAHEESVDSMVSKCVAGIEETCRQHQANLFDQNEKFIKNVTEELNSAITLCTTSYSEKVNEIAKEKSELEAKYTEFLGKINSLNLDKVYSEIICQKKNNTIWKIGFAVGIAAIIILELVFHLK